MIWREHDLSLGGVMLCDQHVALEGHTLLLSVRSKDHAIFSWLFRIVGRRLPTIFINLQRWDTPIKANGLAFMIITPIFWNQICVCSRMRSNRILVLLVFNSTSPLEP